MILHLSGDVNEEMFNQLIRSLNDLKKDDNLHIYWATPGGDADVAIAVVDFINKNKDYIGITFYGEVFSAGMQIFLRVNCKKWILDDTRGMYHFAYQGMSISEGGKPTDEYDRFCMQEMKKAKERTMKSLEGTGLTDKEISLIKKGRDVYFPHERMLEILNGKQ